MSILSPELRWDPGLSNWKRYQRRYVRPIAATALEQTVEGLTHFGIESVEYITLYRGVNTNKEYGVTWKNQATFALYLRADDIHHRKLGSQQDFYSQVGFHEHMHCWRNRYHSATTLLENAATEALAYCTTQQFAEKFGQKDEFDSPMDFIGTLPKSDLLSLRKEVLDADVRLGVVPETERDMGPGSDYHYYVHMPWVGIYSSTEAIGIHAVANHLRRGKQIADLMPLPAEEILEAA